MGPTYINNHFQYEYIPFPELGQGSQFHTYDTHDGRVLKLPLTKEETSVVISKRRHNMNPLSKEEDASIETRVHTLVNGKGRIPAMITHSFYDPTEFLTLLGNPVIVNATHVLPEDTPEKQWGAGRVIYTQDKLMMTSDILIALSDLPTLKSGDIARVKTVIDTYVEHIYELWKFGYADYVFKIGDTGFDKDNNFVLADLGEYSSDPLFMRKALDDKRWLHATMADKIDFPPIPRQVQEYYTKTLNNAFSVEHFTKLWRTKHQCSTCARTDDNVISAFIAAKAAEIDFVDRW